MTDQMLMEVPTNGTLPEVQQTGRALASAPSPESLLQMAIERNMDPASLKELVALMREMKADQAKAAFVDAFAKFQERAPVIGKERTADTGKYKYQFAALEDIARHIKPLCAELGFSYRFTGGSIVDNKIKVGCIVQHVDGHSETATFEAPIDSGAKMNVTQQAASAVSYARRYALLLAFGLTTSDDSDAAYLPAPNPNPERDGSAPQVAPRDERNQLTVEQAYKRAVNAWGTKLGKKSFTADDKARFCKFAAFALKTSDDMSVKENWTVERANEVYEEVRAMDAEDLA